MFSDKVLNEINSLEDLDCFGFTFVNGILKEFKPYRRKQKKDESYFSFSEAHFEDVQRSTIRAKKLDLSEVLSDIYRNNEVDKEQQESVAGIVCNLLRFTNFISSVTFKNLYFGIKKDVNGSMIKIYYSLRIYKDENDYAGTLLNCEQYNKFLDGIVHFNHDDDFKKVMNLLKQRSSDIELCPVLYGCNIEPRRDMKVEHKVYYRNFSQNNEYNHIVDLFQKIYDFPLENVEYVFEQMYSRGLPCCGIGFSSIDTVRVYFRCFK